MKITPQQVINKVSKIFKTLKQEQKAPVSELVKAFQSMLEEEYYSDVIEILLLERLRYEFSRSEVFSGKDIPLPQVWKSIKNDIHYGKECKKSELIHILKSHETSNKLKMGTVLNGESIIWSSIIDKTIKEMKEVIYWNKSQNN